jgi:hypothetical protein
MEKAKKMALKNPKLMHRISLARTKSKEDNNKGRRRYIPRRIHMREGCYINKWVYQILYDMLSNTI